MTLIPAFDAAHTVLKDELPLVAAGEPYTARGIAIRTVSEAVKHLTVVSPEDEAALRSALDTAHSLDFGDYMDEAFNVNYEKALHAALDAMLTLGLVAERVLGIESSSHRFMNPKD